MGIRNIAALFLLASTTALAQVTDPVLMRVNGKEVTRSEFEYAFNKNNNNLAGEGQSVEEYLPMYVDFKLKVAEAEALQLDTLSSFREECHFNVGWQIDNIDCNATFCSSSLFCFNV